MKIAFTGKMGSGKSTAANMLVEEFGFHRYSFASKLKEIARDLFKMGVKDRVLLQTLGNKMREVRRSVWVDYVIEEIKMNHTCTDHIVIDDLRYINEANALKEMGFVIIRLHTPIEVCRERRPEFDTTSGDVSEQQIEDIVPDHTINGDMHLSTFKKNLLGMVQKLICEDCKTRELGEMDARYPYCDICKKNAKNGFIFYRPYEFYNGECGL